MNNKYSIIAVASFCMALLVGSSVFAQTTYTFTNAGATGQNGPSQAQVNAEYAATNLAGSVTSNSGIQEWVVPQTGLYSITALGAQGGDVNVSCTAIGGLGASMQGEFNLTSGDVLHILVGQMGVTNNSDAGGGGGTFVVTASNNILVIAGGGGGASNNITNCGSNLDGVDGQTGTAGTAGASGGGTGGVNGNGGNGTSGSGGGGGGFLTNGTVGGFGLAYSNGGTGGSGNGNDHGGFGGGGSGWSTGGQGGGGGGYSGGGTSGTQPYAGGGGGGSLNNGTNQVNAAGANSGDGQVIIAQVGTGIADDVGVIGIASPVIGSCAGTYSFDVDLFNFGTTQINPVNIQWSVNGGTVSTQAYTSLLDTVGGSGSPSASVTLGVLPVEGNVQIKVWTSMPNGQVDTSNENDTVTVEFYASNPEIDLGELALCDGGIKILSASSPEWTSYQWSTGSNDPSLLISSAGTYSITVIDTFGCPASDEVTVANGVTPVINMGTNLDACDAAVLNAGTANGVYQWSTNETTQTITVTESGPYLVTVTTEHGCVGSGGVTVSVHDSPVIDLGSNRSICVDKGESEVIGVGVGYSSYVWNNAQTNNTIVVSGSQGLPLGINEFGLTVWDEYGCSGYDSVLVNLKTCIPAGVADLSSEGFVMYPNPASDLLTVELVEPMDGATVEIRDLSGRLIRSNRLTAIGTVTMNVSEIAPGAYNISILNDQNSVYVKSIVIQ